MQNTEIERLKDQLRESVNKVPKRVTEGGVQATRQWLKQRDDALRTLKRVNVSAQELRAALGKIQ